MAPGRSDADLRVTLLNEAGEKMLGSSAEEMLGAELSRFLDEPSLGLDPLKAASVFRTIHELKAGGTTILLVEQNAHQALRIADRAYVMETGSIVMEGAGRDLLGDPAIRAAYLGE